MQNPKIVMLVSRNMSSRYLFNGLVAKGIKVDSVILENSIKKKVLFNGRKKKLGVKAVFGQFCIPRN